MPKGARFSRTYCGAVECGELVLAADCPAAPVFAVLGHVVGADAGGAGGGDPCGQHPSEGGGVVVLVGVEPVEGHGLGDAVDDDKARGVLVQGAR